MQHNYAITCTHALDPKALAKWKTTIKGETKMKRITQIELDQMLNAHKNWILSNGKEGERAVLQGYNLSARNLACRDLSYIDFSGSRLVGADLQNAKCVDTVFDNCDCTSARFDGADLECASFDGADCTSASFDWAQIGDAYLEKCKNKSEAVCIDPILD